jgi:hypothetical protein
MAAPTAGFETFSPFAVADHACFFKSWLRRIAPDTDQHQRGDESACCPGGFAAPEEHWYRNTSNGFITGISVTVYLIQKAFPGPSV